MINKSKSNVLIIGLGQVGLEYDIYDSSENIILTHSKAFYKNLNFKLIGGVDLKKESRENFTNKYKCNAFTNISDAMELLEPDVIVIASPTSNHLDNLSKVFLNGKPKIIICEKPLAYNLKDASQIVKLCEINNSKLFVNYFRRVEPGFLKVHSLINSKEFVKPFQGICCYSKGLFNTASHFINLFQFLFGEIKGINILKKTVNIIDPNPNFEIEFSDGSIIFLANENKSVFLNNIEIIMQNVKLNFENGGRIIYWNEFVEDEKFSNYKIMNNESIKIDNDFDRIQYHFVEQINLEINNKFNTLCTGKQALETQKVLEEIKNKL